VPEEGLCNGSRMVVRGLRTHCFEVCLLSGNFHGQLQTIPRIKLPSSDDYFPFTPRKQFPVRLCFVMTINKSRGQSFETVGVDLRTPVFSHRQFYIAMSRVSITTGLYVLLPEGDPKTSNIFWPEILQDLTHGRGLIVFILYGLGASEEAMLTKPV
jgi:ATP-dependent DNA helicase PIF1